LAAKRHAQLEKEQYTLNDEAFVKLEQTGNKQKLQDLAVSAKQILHIV
jgi:hypothetical protein